MEEREREGAYMPSAHTIKRSKPIFDVLWFLINGHVLFFSLLFSFSQPMQSRQRLHRDALYDRPHQLRVLCVHHCPERDLPQGAYRHGGKR